MWAPFQSPPSHSFWWPNCSVSELKYSSVRPREYPNLYDLFLKHLFSKRERTHYNLWSFPVTCFCRVIRSQSSTSHGFSSSGIFTLTSTLFMKVSSYNGRRKGIFKPVFSCWTATSAKEGFSLGTVDTNSLKHSEGCQTVVTETGQPAIASWKITGLLGAFSCEGKNSSANFLSFYKHTFFQCSPIVLLVSSYLLLLFNNTIAYMTLNVLTSSEVLTA